MLNTFTQWLFCLYCTAHNNVNVPPNNRTEPYTLFRIAWIWLFGLHLTALPFDWLAHNYQYNFQVYFVFNMHNAMNLTRNINVCEYKLKDLYCVGSRGFSFMLNINFELYLQWFLVDISRTQIASITCTLRTYITQMTHRSIHSTRMHTHTHTHTYSDTDQAQLLPKQPL